MVIARLFTIVKHALAIILTMMATQAIYANPVGGEVIAGNATIDQTATTTQVNQSTDKAVINWRSFDIGNGEVTNFNVPNANSVTLNRVVGGGGASQIFGKLTSNGRIVLVNQAGIYFSPTAYVNVSGLIASTRDISDENFLAGKFTFDGPATLHGSVINQGTIIAANNGLVALIGSNVSNEGFIQANLGNVVLASGEKFTVDLTGDGLINFAVTGESDASHVATVSNSGTIVANGGKILLTAKNAAGVVDNVINMTGVAQAKSVSQKNGQIIFEANGSGVVRVAGKVDVSGTDAGSTGGIAKILGPAVVLDSSAVIDASGYAGGGNILVGGNFHGAGSEQNALFTLVNSGALLNANALLSGNGGQVAVWSDLYTAFHGTITAQGGVTGGNGGFVETSGGYLDVSDAKINLLAAKGATGTWLLDPTDIYIANNQTNATNAGMSGSNNSASTGTGTNPETFAATGATGASLLTVGNLVAALATTNVVVTTTNASGTGNGDIFIVDPISWSSANSLTLSAYRNITNAGSVTNTALISNSGGASVNLRADNTGTGVGTVSLTNSNYVSLSGGSGVVSVYYNPATFGTPDSIYTGGTTPVAYQLINSLGTATDALSARSLGAISNSSNSSVWSQNFALGKNIDATATSGWNSGAGFSPIGNSTTAYSGKFDGQGFTIDSLYMNKSNGDYVGLFGRASTGAAFANIGLTNLNITNATTSGYAGAVYAGGLLGYGDGVTISNSYSSGTLSFNFLNTAQDILNVGSLVGYLGGATGYISDSHSTATLNLTNSATNVQTNMTSAFGGLIGWNASTKATSVNNTYFSGALRFSGTNGFSNIGGLLGYSGTSTIVNNSYNTGTLSAIDATVTNTSLSSVAGLIGILLGTVTNSYNTGNMSLHAGSYISGLIGQAVTGSVISNSYNTGAINLVGSVNTAGGLVAMAASTITNSWNTGAISITGSASNIGGLVGNNAGNFGASSITGSHNTGNVSISAAGTNIGGLVGVGTTLPLSNSYNTGNVSVGNSSTNIGGLVGQLAGQTGGSTISSSYNTGSVTTGTNSTQIGGVIGWVTYPSVTISSIYNLGSITTGTSNTGVGGLIGSIVSPINGGTINISNAYNAGTLTINNNTTSAGGLIGQITATSSNGLVVNVSNSYNIGATNSNGFTISQFAGLIGTVNSNNSAGDAISVSNSYNSGSYSGSSSYDSLISSNTNGSTSGLYWDSSILPYGSAYGVGLTTAQFMDISNFSGWDITSTPSTNSTAPTNAWFIFQNGTRPILMMEYSTNITNAHQLQLMGSTLGANYTLANNIDFTPATINPSDIWGTNTNVTLAPGTGFAPIGNLATPFTGNFDGQNHTINGLYINSTGNDYVGLFGVVQLGSNAIQNLGLTNINYTSSGLNIGGIASIVNSGNINNSYVTGTLSQTALSNTNSGGGLVGQQFGGSINDSYANVNISGNSAQSLGGLVGYQSGSINRSFSLGSVNGLTYIGGLTGYLDGGSITNSYSLASVNAGSGGTVGGLVGYANSNPSSITTSFSAGAVTGGIAGLSAGGLIGQANFSGVSVTNSYWDKDTTGQVGTALNLGVGLNTKAFQAGLPSGFSSSDWGIISGDGTAANGSYPYLLTSNPGGTPRVISGYLPGGNEGMGINNLGGISIGLASGGTIIGTTSSGADGFYYFLVTNGTISDGNSFIVYRNNPNITTATNLVGVAAGSGGSNVLLNMSAWNALDVYGANSTLTNSTLTAALNGVSSANLIYGGTGASLVLGTNTNSFANMATHVGTTNEGGVLHTYNLAYTVNGAITSISSGAVTSVNFTSPVTISNNISTTQNQSYSNVTLGGNAVLASTSGSIAFNSLLDGAYDLSVSAANSVSFGALVGSVSALNSLGVTATTTNIANNIITNNAQSYGAVMLASSPITLTSLSGSGITFNSTLNGSSDLTIANNSGAITFGGSVGDSSALSSLSTGTGNATTIYGSQVTTTGAQSYQSSVTLDPTSNASTTLSSTGAAGITFDSTLDGGMALTLAANSGTITFNDLVGNGSLLGGLTIGSGNTVNVNTTSILTSGSQAYSSQLNLLHDLVLSANDGSTLSVSAGASGASRSLTLQSNGTKTNANYVLGGVFTLNNLSMSGSEGSSITFGGVNKTWNITAQGTGNITNIVGSSISGTASFTGIGTINATSGVNTFNFDDSVNFDGTINGSGSDILNYGAYVASTVDAEISGAKSGQVFAGGGSLSFTGINSIITGGGDDTFTVDAAGSIGSLNAGGGNNSLTTVNNIFITGSNAGKVNLTTSFSNINSLIDANTSGGAAFGFADGANFDGTITGNGSSSLQYSAQTNGIPANITGAKSGDATVNGITTNFTGINLIDGSGDGDDVYTIGASGSIGTVVGNGGNNSLISANSGTWNIFSSSGEGSIAGVVDDFTEMLNLTDTSSGTSHFVFNNGANISNITGNGNTILDYSGYSASNVITANVTGSNSGTVQRNGGAALNFTGVDSIIGGAGDDSFTLGSSGAIGSLNGSGGNNSFTSAKNVAWNITGSNAGTAGTVSFSNMNSLINNSGSGTAFTFADGANLNGSITGSGSDSLNYAAYTATAIAADITGSNSGTVSNGTDTLSFSGVSLISGGAGNDSFSLGTSGTISSLYGNGGSNSFTSAKNSEWHITTNSGGNVGGVNFYGMNSLTNTSSSANVFNFSDEINFNGAITGNGNDTLNYSQYTATSINANITAANAGTVSDGTDVASFSGINAIVGGLAGDSFTVGANGLIGNLSGGAGSNSLASAKNSSWNITAANAGNVGGINFSNMNSLTNTSSGANSFIFADNVNFNGTVTGTGNDSLDYSAHTAAIAANITGNNVGNVVANGITTNFAGINTIAGGSGDDAFTVGASGAITSLVGNGGNNSLTSNNANNTWNITSGDAGNVSGVVLGFSQMQNLLGGSGVNAFVFSNGASISGSIDTANPTGASLDFSAYSTPLQLNLATVDYAGTVLNNASQPIATFTNVGSVYNVATLAISTVPSYIQITGGGVGVVNDPISFTGVTTVIGQANTTINFVPQTTFDTTTSMANVNGYMMQINNIPTANFSGNVTIGGSTPVPPPTPTPTPDSTQINSLNSVLGQVSLQTFAPSSSSSSDSSSNTSTTSSTSSGSSSSSSSSSSSEESQATLSTPSVITVNQTIESLTQAQTTTDTSIRDQQQVTTGPTCLAR